MTITVDTFDELKMAIIEYIRNLDGVMLNTVSLTLKLLTTTIVAPPSNASKWQMGFNSAFKGLNRRLCELGSQSGGLGEYKKKLLVLARN